MKDYAVQMSDGSVRITQVIDESNSTIENEIAKWKSKIPVESIHEIDRKYLPDRDFRNAWKHNGKEIVHDLEIARNIQLDRIRTARAPKMAALDIQYMQALEQGLDTKSIVAQKQALRDITEPLKAMVLSNIDDVKNAFPQELK